MDEHEVESTADAAFFMANDVVNEYHSFPVVQRADLGQDNMYIMINMKWYKASFADVTDVDTIVKLEGFAD